MTLKDIIKSNYNQDLEISGGNGKSIEEAIIIHKTSRNDYVGTEHFILQCIGKEKRHEWELIGQRLFVHNGRKIDHLDIDIEKTVDGKLTFVAEDYYFDITECL
ncbi:hypothetical protein [uncultured Dokdonia sp.]|uniref:hypothetical protein n=1 Tax=uncultured Dokdonia sp. TaxID=575653 RepID=UPI00261A0D38|nr:hypothetical protein [uncultured Dokdonia sp.]